MKLADFDHRCVTTNCPFLGQRTTAGSCLCHMPREDMLLLRVAELEAQLAKEKQFSEALGKAGLKLAFDKIEGSPDAV